MAHVQLDNSGAVIGVFANPQPGVPGYTEIADDDPKLTTFQNSFAHPTVITALAFFARFTQQETAAVWKAIVADSTGALGAALNQGLAMGTINLADPIVATFLGGLVTAGALTQQRAGAIAQP